MLRFLDTGSVLKYLFETLFISPHERNIEVFNSVTRYPILRTFVKNLKYEAVYFQPDLSRVHYFEMLWSEASSALDNMNDLGNLPFQCPDAEINHFVSFVEHVKSRGASASHEEFMIREAMFVCGNFAFVIEGYQTYLAMADYQARCFENDVFQDTITNGLRRLDHLQEMNVTARWTCCYSASLAISSRSKGSPLARTWDPVHPTRIEKDGEIRDRLAAKSHIETSKLKARPICL